jgi:hypothetical protein
MAVGVWEQTAAHACCSVPLPIGRGLIQPELLSSRTQKEKKRERRSARPVVVKARTPFVSARPLARAATPPAQEMVMLPLQADGRVVVVECDVCMV